MRRKAYPLDVLVRVREGQVEAAATALSGAIEARETAERARAAAELERVRHEERAREVRTLESAALARGELSAADLQRQAAWEARVRWEADERARRAREAAEGHRQAEGKESSARAAAARADAEAEVVDRHRARWLAGEDRAAETAAEEGAAEAWRPRR